MDHQDISSAQTADDGQNIFKWEMNYMEAAIFLQEGENNDKFGSHPKNREALPAYLLTHNHGFYTLDLCASLLLLILATVENPSIGLFKNVSTGIHSSLELCALIILGISIALQLRWLGWQIFLKHKRSAIKSSIWVVMAVEAFIVLVRRTSHFRITRCLRPMFLIDNRYFGGVRRFLRQILQSLVPILEVLLLLLFTLILFTILGFFFFSSNPKDPYFTTFRQGFVSLYVLLTTANYPDLMMPAYADNRSSAAFFIVYIAITVYFLMNLMLAIVFTVFSSIEREKFRKLLLHKREACRRAFKLLVTRHHPNKVTFRHFEGLLHKFKPKASRTTIYLLFRYLNKSNTSYLSLKEFCDFFDALDYDWKLMHSDQPYFYDMVYPLRVLCATVQRLVKSKWFHGTVYFVIICNALMLLLSTIYISANNPQSRGGLDAAWYQLICVAFFVVEMTLKVIGHGSCEFFKCNWNIFDFCIVLLSAFGIILQEYYKALYMLTVLTPLRILRLLKVRKRYREIFEIFALLLPTILSAIIVIMIIYYFFAIIGMELFSVYDMKNCCINTTVEQFYKDDNTTVFVNYYYLNTFDNLFIAGVTLFELTVVNNWFIIMEGYASVSGEVSRLYFMIFYLVMMVVMSLVMAFILEAFTFRIQYNETFSNAHTEDKVVVTLHKQEFEFLFDNTSSLNVYSMLDLSSEHAQVEFEGTMTTTKAVLQRRMFKHVIPEWLRQYESTSESRAIDLDRETPDDRSTFAALFPSTSAHPLVQQNALEMYPDEPVFPSAILPQHIAT